MALDSNRILGFVGGLLIALGSVSQFLVLGQFYYPLSFFSNFGITFGILSIIGIILFLVAMNGLSKDYGDSSIFNNALYGFLSSIIGGVVVALLAIAILFLNLSSIISSYGRGAPLPPLPAMTEILQKFIGYFVYVFIAASVVALVTALFYMRSFNRLANKSGVHLFRTAASLIIVGASVTVMMALIATILVFVVSESVLVLLYLPAIGGVVNFAAWIVGARAFLLIKPALSQVPPPPFLAPSPAPGQVRYCPYCGTKNRSEAIYCTNCGKRLEPGDAGI